jgi:hypothetical protein
MVYCENLPPILLDGEGIVTTEQVMITYRYIRDMSYCIFNFTAK